MRELKRLNWLRWPMRFRVQVRDIAKRALETVGQVFGYGIAHGLATRNPATEIRPSDILKSTPKTNYARIGAKELPTLLRRVEVYQGKQVARLAMKLMAMTFCAHH